MTDMTNKLWNDISQGINGINLNLQLGETKRILAKDKEALTTSPEVRKTFDALANEASRIVQALDQLEKIGAIPRQSRWNDPITKEGVEGGRSLGAFATVKFASVGNKELKGKVDTGATTSSLHAERIKADHNRGRVSFVCPELSPNVITMPLAGAQEVHAAGQDGEQRPIVAFDIVIDGVALQGVQFNLNDRSNMDVPVLLGQNAIKAGQFVIDINQGGEVSESEEFPDLPNVPGDMSREDKIKSAVNELVANDVLVSELIKYTLPNVVAGQGTKDVE